ncbi:hypothetical protein HS088_TW16G00169 [Tripterygium wilfordii]|uniref:Mitochondrial transcription termination factor family protein n=1 Tax=Tripterygium wilfordii TaxID=458696 RepID=A0A7J7CI64_TRIWF|nr:uncharacterized protein LOC119980490 [Tripterygium wilfordii]KAF5733729.1 hypothetical protein HS088_TW16G00169 [Tripterygium wilfordii]
MFSYQWTKRLQLLLLPLRYSTAHSRFLNNHQPFTVIKSFSSSNEKNSIACQEDKTPPFTVCYLVNTFGFPLETAKFLSTRVHFENSERPDCVVQCLRNNGLTDKHLLKLVRSFPTVLVADPEKRILPKLEFLRSIGVSGSDLADVVSFGGNILERSLDEKIIPFYNTLKNYLKDDDKILSVLKCKSFVRGKSMFLAHNISTLQRLGVPKSSITFLLTYHPSVLCSSDEKFNREVEKVVGFGFDPSRTSFVDALSTLCSITRESWIRKSEIYRRLGWSEDEFLSAFRSFPKCMDYSEKNITRKMDFFVNKLGWPPAAVAKLPCVLGLSMEKRIIPRSSVIEILLNKGLIMKKPALSSLLTISDTRFRDRFVVTYQEQVPQLLDIFQGKVKLVKFCGESDGISEV